MADAPKKRGCGCTVFLAIILIAFIYLVYYAPKPTGTGTSADNVTRATPAPIRPDALAPMTMKGYPRILTTWGDRVLQIEVMRQMAAKKAAALSACDAVWFAELSESKSVFPNPVILVECENGKR